MSDYEEQVLEPENISPADPDVSLKHIGWLAGLIIVPLIIIGIAIPFVPKQKKPTYKINTNTVAVLPSPAPEVFIATAILASVTGDVQVQRNDIWSKANGEEKVSKDDVIKTGDNSNTTILFGSGSLIRVDANSQIALTAYAKDGDSWTIKINQIIGRTWNRVQKLMGSSVYEVNTPTAVATVRGTAFGVDADPTKSAFTVDEGTVSAKLVDTKSPERKIISEVQIHKQEQIEITPQKVEDVKKAIEERRPIAQIVEARKTEKLPEWIEEHKREIERKAPEIEKMRIELKQEMEKKEIEIEKKRLDFDIPEKSRIPEKIEQRIENKIEERREEIREAIQEKIEERIEFKPTPTPSASPKPEVEEPKPSPSPLLIPNTLINPKNILFRNDDKDKKPKKETASLNRD
jgi:hypothetical protein